jgi:hypothetical protein
MGNISPQNSTPSQTDCNSDKKKDEALSTAHTSQEKGKIEEKRKINVTQYLP